MEFCGVNYLKGERSSIYKSYTFMCFMFMVITNIATINGLLMKTDFEMKVSSVTAVTLTSSVNLI